MEKVTHVVYFGANLVFTTKSSTGEVSTNSVLVPATHTDYNDLVSSVSTAITNGTSRFTTDGIEYKVFCSSVQPFAVKEKIDTQQQGEYHE